MNGTLFAIAFRNVLRHGKRTLITAIVLTAGIGLYIFFESILAGMDRLTIDAMVDLTTSSVSVSTREYRGESSGYPLDFGIPEPEGAAAAIARELPLSMGVTPRTRFVATIAGGRDGLPVVATAVDPARDGGVFTLPKSVAAGTWLDGGGRGIVIGAGLAAELGLAEGDWATVSARTTWDSINAEEYRVVGLLEASAPEVSQAGLYMAYADARELLGDDLPVTELDVALPKGATLDAELAGSASAARSIEAALPGMDALAIGEAAGDYLAMRGMKSKYSMVVIFVVLLIAAVGVVNTVLMSVYSRVREIGVLRAFGMKASGIRRLFALEGLLVGVLGSLGGAALGAGLVWYSSAVGFSIGDLMGKVDLGSLPLGGILRGEWKPATFVFGFAFGTFASWIAALVPARMAARLEVTDALRFV